MCELKKMERYLRVNLLALVLRKKNLPVRGLTKVEKHCLRAQTILVDIHRRLNRMCYWILKYQFCVCGRKEMIPLRVTVSDW